MALSLCVFIFASYGTVAAAEPYRPEAGKVPPLEKAHAYRGELVFVDHANRRGSIRVEGTGKFYRNDPQPFALLPLGLMGALLGVLWAWLSWLLAWWRGRR